MTGIKHFRVSLICIAALLTGFQACAQPVRVAIAANVWSAVEVITTNFTKKTGVKIELVNGSSGKLAAQIENGAPFDVFLSADMELPSSLFAKGIGKMKPRVYAIGNLVFCTVTTNVQAGNWKNIILNPAITKVAIANPATAPYGKAAIEALQTYHLYEKVKNKLVYGESIAQVNVYVASGAVDAAFVSGSLVREIKGKKDGLQWDEVDDSSYTELTQGAILLARPGTGNYKNALRFYNYLFTEEARAVLRSYNYSTN